MAYISPADRYDASMSTLTLTIERELPALEPEAARSFALAVEAMLRMARRRSDDAATGVGTAKPYRTQPRALGLRPGLSYDHVAELIEAADGADWK